MFLINSGNASIGRMVLEKKRKMNPTLMDATIDVSSLLKMLPISMPKRTKSEEMRRSMRVSGKRSGISWSLKKMIPTMKRTRSWKKMMIMLVRKFPAKKRKLVVGVIKFLKDTLLIFSLISRLDAKNIPTNITMSARSVGKR